jgi:diguanylate cyclase (GGDEF)-like protein
MRRDNAYIQMHSYLNNLMRPRALRSKTIVLISIVAMVAIFAVDVADGPQIWSQVLYVFPLCAIALSCEGFTLVLFGLLLALVFQLLTFLAYQMSAPSVVANSIVALAADAMIVGLARVARLRFASIETAAITDLLTGLRNRRGFESVAEREITRQKRYGGVFSLVTLDLDRFKSLNDSKGHDVGDQALRLLGAILRKNIRQSDSIARLGGDEFAIVMPNTEEADCAALCRQLSEAIASQMGAAGFAITASIGYTTCETPPNSVATALQEADEAMYAAKGMSSGLASHSRIAACQIAQPRTGAEIPVIDSDPEDAFVVQQRPSPAISSRARA